MHAQDSLIIYKILFIFRFSRIQFWVERGSKKRGYEDREKFSKGAS